DLPWVLFSRFRDSRKSPCLPPGVPAIPAHRPSRSSSAPAKPRALPREEAARGVRFHPSLRGISPLPPALAPPVGAPRHAPLRPAKTPPSPPRRVRREANFLSVVCRHSSTQFGSFRLLASKNKKASRAPSSLVGPFCFCRHSSTQFGSFRLLASKNKKAPRDSMGLAATPFLAKSAALCGTGG